MNYYKTTNLSIQNNNINCNLFINELLLEYYDESKFNFYRENYEYLRKNMLNILKRKR